MSNESLFAFKALAASLGLAQVEFGEDLKKTGQGDGYLIQVDRNPNSRGAADLGLAKRAGVLGAEEVLRAAEAGNYDLLVVVDHVLPPARVKLLASKVKALVALRSHSEDGEAAWPFVLPMAVAAEQDGSFTNAQGRVQRSRAALSPLGESLPAYALAQRLGRVLGREQDTLGPQELFAALASAHPAFAGLAAGGLDGLGTQGALGSANATAAGAPRA